MKVSALMVVAALVLTGCNCTKNMLKMSSDITAECNPTMLALKGDAVPADITVKFAPKTFEKSTTLKMTPVLVFEGGEIAGEVKYAQGEKVKDNYTVISNANGGEVKMSVSFPYDERAKVCTLELRVEGKCGKKETQFQPITKLPIAKGITSVQDNANFAASMKLLPDNFKKVQSVSQNAQIMYEINKSDVRKNELSSNEIKMLEDFVKEYSTKEGATMSNVQSKGYASPDGPVDLNDKLSKKRGETAKDAISKSMGKDVKYDISSYGEDWDGFKTLVQNSSMKDKELVLQVLQMYSSPVQRDQEIHNMKEVFQVLATDILPKLRRTVLVASAEIKAKSDQELTSLAKSDPSQLDIEEALYIAPQLKNSDARIKVYQAAANKSGDARAYNNLGVEQANAGKFDNAAASLKTASQKGSQPVITDNIGFLALQMGDKKTANDALSKSSNPEAKAALSFANGDYKAATKGLTGYNLAVAQLADGNVAGAKSALASAAPSADVDYLKAVIAAREGDSKGAIANLKSSIAKDASKRDKANKDAEFTALFDNADFKAL